MRNFNLSVFHEENDGNKFLIEAQHSFEVESEFHVDYEEVAEGEFSWTLRDGRRRLLEYYLNSGDAVEAAIDLCKQIEAFAKN